MMFASKIRCEEAFARFLQWTLEEQFGHLAVISLAMEEQPESPEPTEEQYLRYFAHLQKINASHRLWSTYNLLSKSHKKKYGQGLNQWPNIYQAVEQYEYEEYELRFAHNLNNNNMAHFYNVH